VVVNNQNHVSNEKVVIKDQERMALCRCWKSKSFPFCDGSHHKWNKENGDSLGPVIVECKDKG
jgi:CDGSH-type Zn-finger protein